MPGDVMDIVLGDVSERASKCCGVIALDTDGRALEKKTDFAWFKILILTFI